MYILKYRDLYITFDGELKDALTHNGARVRAVSNLSDIFTLSELIQLQDYTGTQLIPSSMRIHFGIAIDIALKHRNDSSTLFTAYVFRIDNATDKALQDVRASVYPELQVYDAMEMLSNG